MFGSLGLFSAVLWLFYIHFPHQGIPFIVRAPLIGITTCKAYISFQRTGAVVLDKLML